MTDKGAVAVIQGITELTPQWTKVEGISARLGHADCHQFHSPRHPATNPPEANQPESGIEDYKKIARFYLQCERYEEARQTLEELLAAFPDQTDLKERLAPSLRAIAQLSAQRLLTELKLRRDAGQHRLVPTSCKRFPTEGVGGEILQGVREMIQEYDTREARRQDVIKHLKALSARMPDTIATREPQADPRRNRRRDRPEHARPHGGLPAKRRRRRKRPTPRSSRWPSAAGCWAPMPPR